MSNAAFFAAVASGWLAAALLQHARAATPDVPVMFVRGSGAARPEVHFTAQGSSLRAWFTDTEVRLSHAGSETLIRFLGTEGPEAVEPLSSIEARVHYLLGGPAGWKTGVPVYSAIRYRELWPGIDVIYSGRRWLKSEFMVAPGADASAIRMRYEGGAPRLDESGALVLTIPGGVIRESAPEIYQQRNGKRVRIPGGFHLLADGSVGFEIGAYDTSVPLLIDPEIAFSTFYGGSAFDAVTGVAVDAAGNCYFSGWTESADLPVAGAVQRASGRADAFMAKLSPAGKLLYATYLGGNGNDKALSIAVDASGSAVVTGWTESDNFPRVNALQQWRGGGRDAFIARLSPAGDRIVFSTYLGGTGQDSANSIALDTAGNTYVAGDTTSANFPILGGVQTFNRGRTDAFVAKLSTTGQYLYGTYLGGAGNDRAAAIAVNTAGEAYVTGSTESTDFPLAGAIQSVRKGAQDAFVTKLDSVGRTLLYSTYLGGVESVGGSPESGNAIAVDATGSAYVAGVTSAADFPLAAALYPKYAGGGGDAFVARLNPAGSALVYSTYLGGSNLDSATGIAIDTAGFAYVTGYTMSENFPAVQPIQRANAGLYDAFVARLGPFGGPLVFASLLGGADADSALAIAIDSFGSVYVGGQTLSYDFPLVNPLQTLNAGNYGGFVTKIRFGSAPSGVSVTPSSGSGYSQVFRIVASDPDGWEDISAVHVLVNSQLAASGGCYLVYLLASKALYLMDDTLTYWLGPAVIGSGAVVENSRCRVGGNSSASSGSGQSLTVDLPLNFKAAHIGSRNIYAGVEDRSGATLPWAVAGTWTVTRPPNQAPYAVSMDPVSGAGDSRNFRVVLSDPDGAADLSVAYVLFSGGTAACEVAFLVQANQLYLLNDSGSAWLPPITPGTAVTVENAQCRLYGQTSASSASGELLALNLEMSFKPAFAGARNILISAQDRTGALAPWTKLGTWTVTTAENHPPVPISITPSLGSGRTQVFQAITSDPDGAADIAVTYVLVQPGTAIAGVCNLAYLRASNSFYLMNNAATAWIGPGVAGTAQTLENGQCRLNVAGSSAVYSGNSQILTFDLMFNSAWTGARDLFLAVADTAGAIGGWLRVGSWSVQ